MTSQSNGEQQRFSKEVAKATLDPEIKEIFKLFGRDLDDNSVYTRNLAKTLLFLKRKRTGETRQTIYMISPLIGVAPRRVREVYWSPLRSWDIIEEDGKGFWRWNGFKGEGEE